MVVMVQGKVSVGEGDVVLCWNTVRGRQVTWSYYTSSMGSDSSQYTILRKAKANIGGICPQCCPMHKQGPLAFRKLSSSKMDGGRQEWSRRSCGVPAVDSTYMCSTLDCLLRVSLIVHIKQMRRTWASVRDG